eukprot:4023095-Prymnesium_polylepis.1
MVVAREDDASADWAAVEDLRPSLLDALEDEDAGLSLEAGTSSDDAAGAARTDGSRPADALADQCWRGPWDGLSDSGDDDGAR